MKKVYKGSGFDEFLEQQGLRAEAEAVAIKRAKAYIAELEIKRKRRPATDRSRK